jgi:hypothetical protein
VPALGASSPAAPVLEAATQLSLFVEPRAELVAIVSIHLVEDHDFVDFIRRIEPRVVVDVRISPRFNYGLLTRRSAFALFREVRATYIDLLTSRLKDSADPVQRLAGPMRARLKRDHERIIGPIVLLTDNHVDNASLQEALEQSTSTSSSCSWEFVVIPTPRARPSWRSAE